MFQSFRWPSAVQTNAPFLVPTKTRTRLTLPNLRATYLAPKDTCLGYSNFMRRFGLVFLGLSLCGSAVAGGPPLAMLRLYNGAFIWIKDITPPPASLKSLAKAKSIVLDINLSKDVTLKKDAGGNQWFTFIVADQSSDWKWTQTSGHGSIKVTNGKVKAGNYTVVVPAAGIPLSVLASKTQHFSVGPGTSGIEGKPTLTITVNKIRGQ
jgi:hypothetical protein